MAKKKAAKKAPKKKPSPLAAPIPDDAPRPTRYSLSVSVGVFGNDPVGVDSTTPFTPLLVGDYLNPRHPGIFAGHADRVKDLKVKAVRHSFQRFDHEYVQYTEICVVVVERQA